MTSSDAVRPHASIAKRTAAFLLLLALYQSAEGLGARVLHNGALANLLMLSCFLAAPLVSRWLGWGWLGAYGLELRLGVGALVAIGLIAAAAAKLSALALGAALGVYTISAGDTIAPLAALNAVALALLITAVPSIAEDILTRGFWLRGAEIAWSGVWFVLGSSFIYLLNHVYRLGEGPIEWARLFCFGLAYAAAAWRWQSLWAAFALHWGWNLTNALLDAFVRVDVTDARASALLSIGAHLALFAVVLAAPKPQVRVATRD